MIRAVVIDDEKRSCEFLINLIEKYCDGIQVIGSADDISGGIDTIKRLLPDLVFLDIRLKTGTSFDILEQLDLDDLFIVFTTAYDEYALRAFKFNAVDYLLKPIDLAELKMSIARVQKQIDKHKQFVNQGVRQLLSFNRHDPTITIASDQSIEFLRVFDIIRLESDGGYTTFHMNSGKSVLSSKHLKIYDEMLQEYNFFRSHQSHLVNIKHVIKYDKTEGGSLILSDSSVVPISRRKKDLFLQLKRGS